MSLLFTRLPTPPMTPAKANITNLSASPRAGAVRFADAAAPTVTVTMKVAAVELAAVTM